MPSAGAVLFKRPDFLYSRVSTAIASIIPSFARLAVPLRALLAIIPIMVTSTVTSVAKMAYTLLVIACLAFAVAADTPTIRNITVVPDYYTKPGMTCAITPSDTGPLADRVPISPLTRQAGLNGTIVQSKVPMTPSEFNE